VSIPEKESVVQREAAFLLVIVVSVECVSEGGIGSVHGILLASGVVNLQL